MEGNEEDALLRAERLLKPGFVVYAIKGPKAPCSWTRRRSRRISPHALRRLRASAPANACAERHPRCRPASLESRVDGGRRRSRSPTRRGGIPRKMRRDETPRRPFFAAWTEPQHLPNRCIELDDVLSIAEAVDV